MGVKVTNNGFGTISSGITSSATTVVLDSGQGARFPTLASGDFFFGTLVDTSNNIEIVKVTARSSDSMTVTRAQDNTSARAFSVGDRFELRPTAALFENAHLDNTPTSTGSLGLPKGTTAQQPTASATEGHIRYDTDDNVIYYSDGSSWIKVSSVIPTLSSVTGNYYAATSANLTLAGTGFLSANLVVTFTHSATDRTVTVTPSSDTAATVTTPSALDSAISAGDTVTIKVTNSDGADSNTQSVTVLALPTGGSISNSGAYRIHTFNSSSTFTVPSGLTLSNVEYLVVAGGGGGGSGQSGAHVEGGGGGGAGGMRTGTISSVSASSNTITVGAGGSGGTSNPSNGSTGSNSSALGITSNGGGSGGGSNTSGGSGGSGGGGGSGPSGSGAGSGTAGQGNNGAAGADSAKSGGGGGAGAVGGAGPSYVTAGNGGAGTASSITGSSVTYAGGGGGGSYNKGTGGSGGGGNGGNANSPTTLGVAGTANTGGGGGGGGHVSGSLSASGGSGIVVIRYQL